MRADLTKVRQMLFNLLCNATKFTEQGEITLECERETHGRRATGSCSASSDTGIGMTPEQIVQAVPGVHAGRRLDDAQVRRHRPGPGDHAALLPDDGRRRHGRTASPARAATFTISCRPVVSDAVAGRARPTARAPPTRPMPTRRHRASALRARHRRRSDRARADAALPGKRGLHASHARAAARKACDWRASCGRPRSRST